MPHWDQLPPEALNLINQYLGNPGIPAVLGALAVIDDDREDLVITWNTTSDVIFVGEAWRPGHHAWIADVMLGQRRVRLTDVPLVVSVHPGYVFTERDIGDYEVELTVLPGFIKGVAHRGFRSRKTVRVARFDKGLKGKNTSQTRRQQQLEENALIGLIMTASLNDVEPWALPLQDLGATLTAPIWRVVGVANNVLSMDHYSSEALYSEDLQEESPQTADLRVLRLKIQNQCQRAMKLGDKLLEFLSTKHLEELEGCDEKDRKKGLVYTRQQLLLLYEELETWATHLPSLLSQLERLFLMARKGSTVSEHTVGSLFKQGAKFAETVTFKHHDSFFELDEPIAGLETMDLLDRLMAKMNEYAKRLMGKAGDGLEIDEQGLKIVQLLEQVRTEIVLVASTSACTSLKAALLDPAGPFCTMFNKLSAQSCADKREDLWSKFAGWWRQMSRGTRDKYR